MQCLILRVKFDTVFQNPQVKFPKNIQINAKQILKVGSSIMLQTQYLFIYLLFWPGEEQLSSFNKFYLVINLKLSKYYI